MTYQRNHLQVLKKRVNEESRQFIQVIYGPRQVGKTTLITQLLNQIELPHQYISADAVIIDSETWISKQWDTARIKFKQSESTEFLLIFDEIQKIDQWSEQVKKEWDKDTRENIPIKVILLGSSRLLLQQGLTESLAGRYESIFMNHWSFSEMQEAFEFSPEQYVWFGGYPGAAPLINDEPRWRDYVLHSLIETSISKDILMLTRVHKPALMKRLFELGCTYSAQILSFSKILGQLQDAGNTTTLAHYLELLDTAGLLAGIEKFSAKTIRQRASSPKFQVYNNALITSQQPYIFLEILSNPQEWGRWIESAIGTHLLHYALEDQIHLYYWRHSNFEVDFVIQRKDQVIGIEVKSGRVKNTSGMDEFNKRFKPDKLLLVGDSGIKWQDFLKINPSDLF